MAEKTIEKFLARAVRLYEQEPGEPFGSPLLGLYDVLGEKLLWNA